MPRVPSCQIVDDTKKTVCEGLPGFLGQGHGGQWAWAGCQRLGPDTAFAEGGSRSAHVSSEIGCYPQAQKHESLTMARGSVNRPRGSALGGSGLEGNSWCENFQNRSSATYMT